MTSRPPPAPRLITLGRLALEDAGGQQLISGESIKPLALLAYLAAAPGRRASRERIIDLFWADRPESKGRASLRQLVFRLREVLGQDAIQGDGGSELRLAPTVRCDRDQFLAALTDNRLDEALALYSGPYAPGLVSAGSAEFEHWADHERERLWEQFVEAADLAARQALDTGEPRRAHELALRILSARPLNQRGWRNRIEAEAHLGSPARMQASVAEFQRVLDEAGERLEPRSVELLKRLAAASDASLNHVERTLHGELVGRSEEFAALYQAWQRAAGGLQQRIHLQARAGLGKSRLLNDFALRLLAERGRIAQIRAMPRQRDIPWSIAADLVGRVAELPGASGIGSATAAILVDLMPPLGDRFPAAQPRSINDPEERTRKRIEAITDLLRSVLHEAPLALLLDDLHWWDPTSLQVSHGILDKLQETPLLVVAASRPGRQVPDSELTIALDPLSMAEVEDLLRSLSSGPSSGDLHPIAAAIHQITHGSPLLTVETLRLGIARGAFLLAADGLNLEGALPFLASLDPDSLLAQRLARLTPEEGRTMALMAVLGGPLPLDSEPFPGFHGTLPHLEQKDLVARTERGLEPSHDAIAEAVDERLTEDQRRQAHRDAARALEEADDAGMIIRHLIAAHELNDAGTRIREWIRQQRRNGDRRPPRRMVDELTGFSLAREELDQVMARLPAVVRIYRPILAQALLVTISACLGAVALAAVALHRSREDPIAVDFIATRVVEPRRYHLKFDGTRSEGSFGPARFQLQEDELDSSIRSIPPGDLIGPWFGPGDKIAWSEKEHGPNGPTSLFVRSDGVARSIAPAPGDDVQARFSPDGRWLAFLTTRYASGAGSFDLAVYDLEADSLSLMATGPDGLNSPVWAPEGTRVGYLLRSAVAGSDRICWTSLYQRITRCSEVPEVVVDRVLGWLGFDSFLILLREDRGLVLARFDRATGVIDRTPYMVRGGVAVSPDGRWMLCQCQSLGTRGVLTAERLVDLDRGGPGTELPLTGSVEIGTARWHLGADTSLLPSVISPDTVEAMTGVPLHLPVVFRSPRRGEWKVPGELVGWRSASPGMVDVRGHLVLPLREGVAQVRPVVEGKTGRPVVLRIIPGRHDVAFRETWTELDTLTWRMIGDPLPRTVRSARDSDALLVNGDREYESGVATRQTFDPSGGLALETTLTGTVTRAWWQQVRISLTSPDFDNIGLISPSGMSCGTARPSGEGGSAISTMMTPGGAIPIDSAYNLGRPMRIRLQVFPDGSCGLAIDGTPVARVRPELPFGPLVVGITGQTVGTDLLVGPVTVWSGVPPGVDWGALPDTP